MRRHLALLCRWMAVLLDPRSHAATLRISPEPSWSVYGDVGTYSDSGLRWGERSWTVDSQAAPVDALPREPLGREAVGASVEAAGLDSWSYCI